MCDCVCWLVPEGGARPEGVPRSVWAVFIMAFDLARRGSIFLVSASLRCRAELRSGPNVSGSCVRRERNGPNPPGALLVTPLSRCLAAFDPVFVSFFASSRWRGFYGVTAPSRLCAYVKVSVPGLGLETLLGGCSCECQMNLGFVGSLAVVTCL